MKIKPSIYAYTNIRNLANVLQPCVRLLNQTTHLGSITQMEQDCCYTLTAVHRINLTNMKLIKTQTIIFEKGKLYRIEQTVAYPPEYFKKPVHQEDYFDGERTLKKGEMDDLSDLDECVKSFKIVRKWYE